MKRTLLFLVAAAASMLTTQVNVYAHHSFAATYFEDQTVTIKGNPGRNPDDHRIRMQSIERPSDGWSWKGVVQ